MITQVYKINVWFCAWALLNIYWLYIYVKDDYKQEIFAVTYSDLTFFNYLIICVE